MSVFVNRSCLDNINRTVSISLFDCLRETPNQDQRKAQKFGEEGFTSRMTKIGERGANNTHLLLLVTVVNEQTLRFTESALLQKPSSPDFALVLQTPHHPCCPGLLS